MRITLFLSALMIFFFVSCKNNPSGSGNTPTVDKPHLYVTGVMPEPMHPGIGVAFPVTVTVSNDGKAHSGEYDLFISLQRKDDGSVYFGSEKIKMRNQEVGEVVKVTTGNSFFFKEAGDYELMINTSTADGTNTEMRWQLKAQ